MNKQAHHLTHNEKFSKWLLIGRPPRRWLDEVTGQLRRKGITLEEQSDLLDDSGISLSHGLILFYDSGQEATVNQVNAYVEQGGKAVVAAESLDWKETRNYLKRGFLDCISIARGNELNVEEYAGLVKLTPNTS